MPHVMQCHASHLSKLYGIDVETWVCEGLSHAIMHAKEQSPLDLLLQSNRTSVSQSWSLHDRC